MPTERPSHGARPRYQVDPAKPTVLLYGHYDVQPPDPLEAWVTPPFEPTIRDGRIYARGIGDNKGQHFAQILAIESQLAVHGELPCNVILLLEGEEEIGSPHIADFVREHRDALRGRSRGHRRRPAPRSGPLGHHLRRARRGCVRAAGAQAPNRDLHSGNWGGVAPNPIWTPGAPAGDA